MLPTRAIAPTTLLTLLLAGLVTVPACNNECDFFERCDGTTRLVCGEGPDQAFGRKIHEVPCEAENPVCVQMDASHALCVRDPSTSCDDSFPSSCDGTVRIFCPQSPYTEPQSYPTRFVTGTECAVGDAGSCVVEGGAAICK